MVSATNSTMEGEEEEEEEEEEVEGDLADAVANNEVEGKKAAVEGEANRVDDFDDSEGAKAGEGANAARGAKEKAYPHKTASTVKQSRRGEMEGDLTMACFRCGDC